MSLDIPEVKNPKRIDSNMFKGSNSKGAQSSKDLTWYCDDLNTSLSRARGGQNTVPECRHPVMDQANDFKFDREIVILMNDEPFEENKSSSEITL